MKRRPVFAGAVFLALLFWILFGILKLPVFPEFPWKTGVFHLQGIYTKAEIKSSCVYVYLKNAECERAESAQGVPADPENIGQAADGDFPESRSFRISKVLLTMDSESFQQLQLIPGNEIRIRARYTGFQTARNYGNFDEASFYRSLGVAEKFEAVGKASVSSHRIYPLSAAMQWLRGKLNEALLLVTSGQEDSHAAIFAAVVTGERSGLDAETKELYRKSGIAHILAISGLHISLIGMGIFSFLRRRTGFSFAATVSGIIMILFCILSGGSASAVRATVMFLLRLLALRFGKTFDLLTGLGIAGILLLISNPLLLFYSGFLLSFGAIAGIGILEPAFERLLSGTWGFSGNSSGAAEDWNPASDSFPWMSGTSGSFLNRKRDETLKTFYASFLSSLSVTLFSLPVMINSYYEVPVFSVLLNLFVVPMMGLVLGSGMLSALAGILSLFLGRILIGAGVYLVSLIELLCGLMDRIPFSILICGQMSPVRIGVYYGLLGFLLFAAFRFRRRGRAVFAVVFLCLILTVFAGHGSDSLKITLFDVDQGESILLESPSGSVFLIDGGSTSVKDLYRYRLESALKFRGISVIDYVIITHPDTDHVSGILAMLEKTGAGNIQIRHLLTPEVSGNENLEKLVHAAEHAGVSVTFLHSGMKLEDTALTLRCLHPSKDYRSDNANAYSAVMELSFGNFRALFTGDIEENEEQLLLNAQRISDCDLLKVAHHGSNTSTSSAFLSRIQPELALISAGVNNSYGHPHAETLERLSSWTKEIFCTADAGEIEITVTPSGRYTVKTKLCS